ncbi:enoyl-CoA hydratase [Citricoccus zhacaiensis]|uniref:Enoyl-CoA hydratase n=1 Tax=Citricoccus zhacaiensis TaxID=489142 RepID=A0ABQ2LVV8_9MICC|nr:enoyl-CoA hydratase/isomerase family protein [Citricoccus zhacaiensis]GGO43695.1 enoyl-CoA hydratase [Citricoccus zhacaiensis]
MTEAGRRVTLTVTEQVGHLELSRPEARNAMDPDFVRDFGDALDQAVSRPDIRALLVTGQGPSFCVGGDLSYFTSHPDTLEEDLGWMVDHWHEVLGRFASIDLPVITAVHGGTAGGGLGMVWCADHVIAAEDTRIAAGFADIGLSGDGGASWYLPRLVGHRRAQAMILDNVPVDAPTALEWGIVHSVVPRADLMDAAWTSARRFARRSAPAFRQAKRLLRESSTHGLVEHLHAEAEAIHACAASSDSAEGISAFVEKRPAVFTEPYPAAGLVSTLRG